MKTNPVRTSSRWVMSRAKDVTIDQAAVLRVANTLAQKKIIIPSWSQSFHLTRGSDEVRLRYLFVLDALNFCFWSKSQKWSVPTPSGRMSGYMALAWQLKKFFSGNPRADFANLYKMPFAKFKALLAGSGDLLLMRERHKILKAVSHYLIKNYGGDPKRLLAAGGHNAARLVELIARFPSFDDQTKYSGHKVYFYKRSQILVGDIWGAFRGKGIGKIKDIEYLTAFADYKIPQILRDLGVLSYSKTLASAVDRKVLIPQNSRQEIEIRAATVCAVEDLRLALQTKGIKLASIQIDWYLWVASKKKELHKAHHLTKTIYY